MAKQRSFRPHRVLGDAVRYQESLEKHMREQRQDVDGRQAAAEAAAATAAEPPATRPLAGLAAVDAASLPAEVWAAARLLGDPGGLRLLEVYWQLAEQREVAARQLSLNATRRGEPAAASGRGCGGDSGGARTAGRAPGQLLERRTVMDALMESHDERVLARWEAQQAAWQQQAAQLAAATGKQPQQMTLARGDQWRSKQELLAVLEAAGAPPAGAAAAGRAGRRGGAQPPSADGGGLTVVGGSWEASLRNANERFVAIGNMFSGLFLAVRSGSSPAAAAGLTTIRTPALAELAAEAAAAATAATEASQQGGRGQRRPASPGGPQGGPGPLRRRRSWGDEPYLLQRLAAVKGYVASAPPDAGSLAVAGCSLEAGLLAGLALRPVRLEDVEARLAVAAPAVAAQYRAAKEAEAARAVAAEAAEAGKAQCAAARAAASAPPYPGPHLEQDAHSLTLHFAVPPAGAGAGGGGGAARGGAARQQVAPGEEGAGAPGCAVLAVANVGTAAVHYAWARLGRQRHPRAAGAGGDAGAGAGARTGAAAGGGVGAPDQEHQQQQRPPPYCFHLPQRRGVILPGERQEFRFSFKASAAGCYHERWVMATSPPLEPDRAAGGPRRRQRGQPLAVALRGVAAAAADGGGLARQRGLEARLAAQDRELQVQRMLQQLVDGAVVAAGASHQQRRQQQQRSHWGAPDAGGAAAAASWAAANPPGSLPAKAVGSGCSGDGGASEAPPDHVAATKRAAAGLAPAYYYHPAAVAALAGIYSAACELLQPASAPLEPAKKGAAKSLGTAAAPSGRPLLPPASQQQQQPPSSPPANARRETQHAAAQVQRSASACCAELPLPGAWDGAVASVTAAVEQLVAAGTHAHQAAVLSQRLRAALLVAALPASSAQVAEAACRAVALSLADAVPAAAAEAAAAAPGSEAAHGAAHGARGSSGGAAAAGRAHHNRGSAGGAASGCDLEGYQQRLQDGVWGAARQALGSTERLLSHYQRFAALLVDEQAAAAAAAASSASAGGALAAEALAWRRFELLRAKHRLGLG